MISMPSWTSYLVKYAISNLKKIQPALIKIFLTIPTAFWVVFIWLIFIRDVIDLMTCYHLNWPKIKF